MTCCCIDSKTLLNNSQNAYLFLLPDENVIENLVWLASPSKSMTCQCLLKVWHMHKNKIAVQGKSRLCCFRLLWPAPEVMSTTATHIWKITFIALAFICMMVANVSKVFFVMICYILYKEFEYVCRTFSMKIR